MTLALVVMTLLTAASEPALIAGWEFDTEAEVKAWIPNSGLANVHSEDGILSFDASGSDPFFTRRELAIEAKPCQFVVFRVKADQSGSAQLYWSNETEGPHGGFSSRKLTTFKVPGDNAWHEIVLFPSWHPEGTIRQIRLDVYPNTHFAVDWIRVYQWGAEQEPRTDTFSWTLEGDTVGWQIHPGARELFAPPLQLTVADKGWVTVALKAKHDCAADLVWATSKTNDLVSETFPVQGGGETQLCNIELQGNKAWHDHVVMFGVRLPSDPEAGVELESITISDRPAGPAHIEMMQFGFEDAVNRAERTCRVVARLLNRGGEAAPATSVRLILPEGLTLANGEAEQPAPALDYGERADLTWNVQAERPGAFSAKLDFAEDTYSDAETTLTFAPAFAVQHADYVPEPTPIQTTIDVLAYYFPGWHADARWDPVRRVAPIRKPLLGYYDEANPECVDWQIKWAAENGITGFLVDWYWADGKKHLTHWFDAYRKARYRDHLKVAIMWANHNAPKTHSAEDWRNVTQEWIDHYFNLDTYYRVDGKPAIYIWSPNNIRNDLGGTEAVKAVFQESQEMAKAAGHEGITYVALGYGHSKERSTTLAEEGYSGFTTYHEWGDAVEMSSVPKRAQFEDVVATSRHAWDEQEAMAEPLTYHPVVETGWDARPWHGSRALAILGRNADLFEQLLGNARAFAEEHQKQSIILSPLNEWGEGSYIEPCTEFGFDMYERIRTVFGKGDPASWPVNIAPADVGRGPYEFPQAESRTQWNFDSSLAGWIQVMCVDDLKCADGAMRFRTTSDDPAITIQTPGLRAEDFATLVVRMQFTGPIPEGGHGQLYWSGGVYTFSESTATSFPLETDGVLHEYRLDLKAHPRWRGDIASLRFDPCQTKGVTVVVDEIRFVE